MEMTPQIKQSTETHVKVGYHHARLAMIRNSPIAAIIASIARATSLVPVISVRLKTISSLSGGPADWYSSLLLILIFVLMGCCESSFEQPESSQRPRRIDKMLESPAGDKGIRQSSDLGQQLSDIDITLRVQEIWSERNLADDEGLNQVLAFPLIADHIKRKLNLSSVDDVPIVLIKMAFAEIDTNENQIIEKQELFDFFKKHYGRKKAVQPKEQPVYQQQDDESFDYDANSQKSKEEEQKGSDLSGLPSYAMHIRERLPQYNYKSDPNTTNDKERRPQTKLDDGSLYDGEWDSSNQKSGKGMQIYPDGSIYEGYWENDLSEGLGRYIHANGDVYEGEWRAGKPEGYGVCDFENGARYEGHWKNEMKHGLGKELLADDSTYEGEFFEGEKQGQGKFRWADGSTYEGQFHDNLIHGLGTYNWSDGRSYTGPWHNNDMHGVGVFKWPDGRKYEGAYVNGIKEGQGVFTWSDGRQYEGGWLGGKQHGEGVIRGLNGVRRGIWEQGKRQRWLEQVSNNE